MKHGVITISFDDGYLDTYKYAISYLDKHNIKCTFAVPAGLVGKTCENRPVVTWAHLKKMYKNGHDIASHTMTHVNFVGARLIAPLQRKRIFSELIQPVKLLKSRLGSKPSSFVYPYINKLPNKKIQTIVKKTYSSARISENFPVYNKLPVKNKYAIRGFCLNSVGAIHESPLHMVMSAINHAIKNKLWLILVFHLVGKKNTKSAHRDAPYRFFIHIDEFKDIIDFITKQKISTKTQYNVTK